MSAPALRMILEPTSPHAQLALFILHLKHIPYTSIPMNWVERTPEHLAANPFGQVPTLLSADFSLFESRAIARYLDDLHPALLPRLTPTDLRERALMEQWVSVESNTVAPELRNFLRERCWGPRFSGRVGDEAVIEKAMKSLRKSLAILDGRLAASRYLAGERLTLADCFFVPLLDEVAGTKEAEELLGTHPHLKAWYEGLAATDGWKAVKDIVEKNQEALKEQMNEWRKKMKIEPQPKPAEDTQEATTK